MRLTPEQREQLDKIAYERSGPEERTTLSGIVREAIDDYLDETDE